MASASPKKENAPPLRPPPPPISPLSFFFFRNNHRSFEGTACEGKRRKGKRGHPVRIVISFALAVIVCLYGLYLISFQLLLASDEHQIIPSGEGKTSGGQEGSDTSRGRSVNEIIYAGILSSTATLQQKALSYSFENRGVSSSTNTETTKGTAVYIPALKAQRGSPVPVLAEAVPKTSSSHNLTTTAFSSATHTDVVYHESIMAALECYSRSDARMQYFNHARQRCESFPSQGWSNGPRAEEEEEEEEHQYYSEEGKGEQYIEDEKEAADADHHYERPPDTSLVPTAVALDYYYKVGYSPAAEVSIDSTSSFDPEEANVTMSVSAAIKRSNAALSPLPSEPNTSGKRDMLTGGTEEGNADDDRTSVLHADHPSYHSVFLFDEYRFWEGDLRRQCTSHDVKSAREKSQEERIKDLSPRSSPSSPASASFSRSESSRFVTTGRHNLSTPTKLYQIDYFCIDAIEGTLVEFVAPLVSDHHEGKEERVRSHEKNQSGIEPNHGVTDSYFLDPFITSMRFLSKHNRKQFAMTREVRSVKETHHEKDAEDAQRKDFSLWKQIVSDTLAAAAHIEKSNSTPSFSPKVPPRVMFVEDTALLVPLGAENANNPYHKFFCAASSLAQANMVGATNYVFLSDAASLPLYETTHRPPMHTARSSFGLDGGSRYGPYWSRARRFQGRNNFISRLFRDRSRKGVSFFGSNQSWSPSSSSSSSATNMLRGVLLSRAKVLAAVHCHSYCR